MSTGELRIGFNARMLTGGSLRGWNRYTVNLLAELPSFGVRPVLYSPSPVATGHLDKLPTDSFDLVIGGPRRILYWEQYWLPSQIQRDRVPLLHATFNFGLPLFGQFKKVLTLHDAIDYVYYYPKRSWSDHFRISALLSDCFHFTSRRVAHEVVTVSDHAKQDIHKAFRIPLKRLSVTYEAADAKFRPASESQIHACRHRLGLLKPYFLYLGGWEARKNVPFLVQAFAASHLTDVELVLVGGREEQKSELTQLANQCRVQDRVRLLGWVEDEDLPSLFSGALGFVYPSAYEGFGLQVCEAMACHCPTLVSDVTSLPEILGDGGVTFPLADPRILAELLQRLATDSCYRAELARRAAKRIVQYSWTKCARETAAIYRKALGL